MKRAQIAGVFSHMCYWRRGGGDFRILQPIHSFMVSMIAGNFANAQSFGVSRPAGDQS